MKLTRRDTLTLAALTGATVTRAICASFTCVRRRAAAKSAGSTSP